MTIHPQQRLTSPSRSLSLLLHLAGLASFLASFNYLSQFEYPVAEAYGGHYQFLTILGLGLSAITFAVGIAADLTLSPSLFLAKNTLALCATPLEVLVAVLYWGIRLIDHRLLFPTEFMLPIIPDVGFHAMPAIMLSLDMVFFSPPWTVPSYTILGLANVLAFLYWGWVEHCYSHNGWYPYPMFEMLSTLQRALLFTFSALLMTGNTVFLKVVYGHINGPARSTKVE